MSNSTPPRFPPDYHTHNLLCRHADGQPLDYARQAPLAGCPAVAATDHCPTDDGFGTGHRMALDQFPAYLAAVEEARAAGPVTVLLGVEADYYPGCERFLAPWLEQHPFDLVLGSVHFLDYWAANPVERSLSDGGDPRWIWEQYFARIGALADTGLYDIVAHLDLPKKFGNPIDPALLRELALPALDRIARAGMAIEINTSGLVQPPRACYPSPDLLRWARERGIGLTFGSDAHAPQRVGADFDHALALARAAGFTHHRVFARRAARDLPLPA